MVNLLKYNLHWKSGFLYGFPQRRDLFWDLVNQSNNRQIVGLVGLRRTGKTVLLKQLMDHLIAGGVPRDRIIYYSFDDEIAPLEEIFQDFYVRMGTEIHNAGKLHFFLDEIQKLDNWQNQMKYYYDTYPNIKFYISGSSSLFIKKKAEESLAGRIFLFYLPVLSFREFLKFKGEEEMLKKPKRFKEELIHHTESYVRRQLPEIVNATDDFVRMYVESIITKLVFEDLPKVFPIEYDDALKKIIKIVACMPGIVTDYESLAGELGMNRKTLANYISYLERGFLIQKCYNFSRNMLTTEKKMKRLYISSTTFMFSLADHPEQGKIMENLIINASGTKFFWRKGNNEVDAVLETDEGIIPVESKYSSTVRDKELKGLIKFMEMFDVKLGYVVTKDFESEKELGGKRISFIPFWKWLLSF